MKLVNYFNKNIRSDYSEKEDYELKSERPMTGNELVNFYNSVVRKESLRRNKYQI